MQLVLFFIFINVTQTYWFTDFCIYSSRQMQVKGLFFSIQCGKPWRNPGVSRHSAFHLNTSALALSKSNAAKGKSPLWWVIWTGEEVLCKVFLAANQNFLTVINAPRLQSRMSRHIGSYASFFALNILTS